MNAPHQSSRPPPPPSPLRPGYLYGDGPCGFNSQKFVRELLGLSALAGCAAIWVAILFMVCWLTPKDGINGAVSGLLIGLFIFLSVLIPFCAMEAGWQPSLFGLLDSNQE